MNPERWRQIEQLYHSVLQREPEHRAAFLAAASGDDEELRREVEFLLAQSGSTGGLIDRPAWEAATDLADSIDTSTILAAGMRLGPYQILGPLGEGGMGTVYRGLDTRLNRAVAIKFSSEHFSRRFEREARIISALNHPHICTLYDVGAMPSGSSYMVTELVEGETLRDWIKRAPAVERSLEIARQVLEALHAAHRAGIIHRDLKPANIMVRFDGYVKVLDFGIAKRIALPTDCASATDLTLPGQIIGTIRYMSPEQIQGQEVDQRCDLFAFGIILYEMLTGEHPWPRKTTVDTLHAILHDEPPSVESGWVSVVNKLLRKNRHERFPSAEAVLAALASPTPPQAPFPALSHA
jgi:serine/threonine protein kinase